MTEMAFDLTAICCVKTLDRGKNPVLRVFPCYLVKSNAISVKSMSPDPSVLVGTESLEQVGKITWYRRFETQVLPGYGVFEAEEPGVQRLPGECLHGTPGGLLQGIGLGREMRAVFLVTNKRIADMGHVDADLVGPSGFEPAFDKTCIGAPVACTIKVLDDRVMGDCLARVGAGNADYSAFEPV